MKTFVIENRCSILKHLRREIFLSSCGYAIQELEVIQKNILKAMLCNHGLKKIIILGKCSRKGEVTNMLTEMTVQFSLADWVISVGVGILEEIIAIIISITE